MPTDCIDQGARSPHINPDECVDCGACKLVCRMEAIEYETDLTEDDRQHLADNAAFSSRTTWAVPSLGVLGGAQGVGRIGVDTPGRDDAGEGSVRSLTPVRRQIPAATSTSSYCAAAQRRANGMRVWKHNATLMRAHRPMGPPLSARILTVINH